MVQLNEDKLIIKNENVVKKSAKDGWELIKIIWVFFRDELPQFLSNWRTVPRLMMGLYAWMVWDSITWFTGLENPTTAQAGFVSVIVGAGAAWFGLYVNGKKTNIKK
jgi:hypothetical protein